MTTTWADREEGDTDLDPDDSVADYDDDDDDDLITFSNKLPTWHTK